MSDANALLSPAQAVPSPHPEEAWLAGVAQGCKEAFSALYENCYPAGTVKTATTKKNIVGTQFCITLFIAKSCAIAGTPMIIPLDKNTAKKDVMNEINTTYVSNSIFILITLFNKFYCVNSNFS